MQHAQTASNPHRVGFRHFAGSNPVRICVTMGLSAQGWALLLVKYRSGALSTKGYDRYMWYRISHEGTIKEWLRLYNPTKSPVWHEFGHNTRLPNELHWYPLTNMNSSLEKREIRIMATKGTRKRRAIAKGEYTFVRVNLTKDDKTACAAWFEKAGDTLDKAMQDMLESGHKVSFSYSEINGNVTCTFTGKPDESVNEYRMLTSFASSWWQALATNLWKHNEFFKGGVWEDIADGEDFG